jgi:uncharacterized membrane protein
MSQWRWILLALFAGALAQLGWYLPRMPELLASHFGAAGTPNGYLSRGAALGLHLALLGTLAVIFLVLPGFVTRLDSRRINLPHREYWLSPERRAETLASIRARLECMGCATMAFVLVVMELLFRANLHPPAVLPMEMFWPVLGCFMAFSTLWMATFVRRFARPPGQ